MIQQVRKLRHNYQRYQQVAGLIMYNIKTQIGGPGGVEIDVDSASVLVELDARRRWASVRVVSFEVGGHAYCVDSEEHVGHHAALRPHEVGELVLNVACSTESTPTDPDIARALLRSEDPSEFVRRHEDGTYSVPSPERSSTRFSLAELERASKAIDAQLLADGGEGARGTADPAQKAFEFALDCLADAFADYCRGNSDPDHLPSGWVEVAHVLLGGERCAAICQRAVDEQAPGSEWSSPDVMLSRAALGVAADWLEELGDPEHATATERLRAASKEEGAQAAPRAALVSLPPREEWPEGMETGPGRVHFDGWIRGAGRTRDIAAALLAAASESEVAQASPDPTGGDAT